MSDYIAILKAAAQKANDAWPMYDDSMAGSASAVLKLINDYDALAAQRDEGLARENQLREERDSYQRVGIQAQQRLAEATDLLKHMTCSYHGALQNGYDRIIFLGGDCDSVERMEGDDPFYAKARAFLASPGCADGEKAE